MDQKGPRMKQPIIALALLLIPTVVLAGAVGGPKYRTFRIAAKSTESYTVKFEGGEKAEILVVGDGTTDLDCTVFDEDGDQVAMDMDAQDICRLTWYPPWTMKYRLRIKNRGTIWNDFTIRTN